MDLGNQNKSINWYNLVECLKKIGKEVEKFKMYKY